MLIRNLHCQFPVDWHDEQNLSTIRNGMIYQGMWCATTQLIHIMLNYSLKLIESVLGTYIPRLSMGHHVLHIDSVERVPNFDDWRQNALKFGEVAD